MPLLTLYQMQERLEQMSYRDYKMSIYEGAFEGYKLLIEADVEDTTKPGEMVHLHIVSPLHGYLSVEQFDYDIAKRLIRIAIHECQEELKINGKPLYDPHREYADRDLI